VPLANDKNAPSRVMLIGFDGATLDLIQPWVKAGFLPNFARLMSGGACGPLESTIPPVTPAAWSTMATGMNQGKHGVYDFFARREGSYDTYVVNARDRHGATLWGLLGQAGYRVTVFNVPATYPPDQVNGQMVSGLLTPSLATDASYPLGLLPELKRAVPGFDFHPPGFFSKGKEVEFVQSVLDWDKMTLDATEFLMKREPWDFLFAVFVGTDIMSHWMWREMVTQGASVQTSDPTVREKLAHAIEDIYRQADRILGRMLELAGETTYVMVVSDHGFGPLDYYLHLNAWLAEHGYLQFKRTPGALLRYVGYRLGLTPLNVLELMRKLHLAGPVQETAGKHNDFLRRMITRVFLSLDDVDWSRTTVYTRGFAGPLFVNLKGREPQGIVETGAEFEAVLNKLERDVRSLKHPVTGEAFVSQVVRTEDVYSGPYIQYAPDFGFGTNDPSIQPFGVHDFASNRWFEPTPDRTGTHRMNGIFFLRGPGVQPGAQVEGAGLIDVAPTVLALMGVPIPSMMDGRALSTALTAEMRNNLHIAFSDQVESAGAEPAGPVLSEQEEKIIRERLEALGYFG
jgi:predicted AlkP superfamily phosphohydrolase/phosphomutase